MNYCIIGTGNMAFFLAKRLTAAGHQCDGIYGRNKEAAEELASSVNSTVYERINDIKDNPDLCFLAVADNAIDTIAKNISFSNTVLVHTAGAVDISVISGSARDCAVLWPIYSIMKNNLPNHREIPCAWEANTNKASKYIQSVGHGVTDILFEAKSDLRNWLHLAAVIGNNFINHLMAICEEICTGHNLPFSTVQPIIEQTLELMKRSSPHNLQTGPARRGDYITLHKHNLLLQSHPLWQHIYKDISVSIESMYKDIPKEKVSNR